MSNSIRFINNTNYQEVSSKELLDEVKHLLVNTNITEVESIELNDKTITVFGEDCILLEHELNKSLRSSGSIRWFDKLGGVGMIRLDSGKCISFYSCNVEGANSCYHQLTTNIDFNTGDEVEFDISMDPNVFRDLGAINIKHKGVSK